MCVICWGAPKNVSRFRMSIIINPSGGVITLINNSSYPPHNNPSLFSSLSSLLLSLLFPFYFIMHLLKLFQEWFVDYYWETRWGTTSQKVLWLTDVFSLFIPLLKKLLYSIDKLCNSILYSLLIFIIHINIIKNKSISTRTIYY